MRTGSGASCVDRRAVEGGEVGQVRGGRDGAEREVDERVVVARPPVRQRRRAARRGGIGSAKRRASTRAAIARMLERRGHHREVRRLAQPVARRIGRETERGPRAVDAAAATPIASSSEDLQAEADARERDRVELGDQRPGEVRGLADDDVRAPGLDGRALPGQGGADVDPGEELASITGRWRRRCPAARTAPSAASTRPPGDRRSRMNGRPGALDVVAVLMLGGDEHLVARAQEGACRTARAGEMAGAAPRGHENPHGRSAPAATRPDIRPTGVRGAGGRTSGQTMAGCTSSRPNACCCGAGGRRTGRRLRR